MACRGNYCIQTACICQVLRAGGGEKQFRKRSHRLLLLYCCEQERRQRPKLSSKKKTFACLLAHSTLTITKLNTIYPGSCLRRYSLRVVDFTS